MENPETQKPTNEDRFTDEDRKRVVQRLQEVQNVRLTLQEGKRLFHDATNKHYFILGGSGLWHGIQSAILPSLLKAGDGKLVIAKKYRTRMDICAGVLGDFVANIGLLPRRMDGGVNFHLVVEDEGLGILEMPDYVLKTISTIPLASEDSREESRHEAGSVVNAQVQDSEQEPEAVSHADVQAKLIRVGNYLGYRTYTPDRGKKSTYGELGDLCTEQSVPDDFLAKKKIDDIRYIDVIWFNESGVPTHGFEVEHSTDVTKGLLRLYQAFGASIKMFIIAQEEKRGRFKSEREKEPFRKIRDRYIFKNYRELDEFFEAVKTYRNMHKRFMTETE